jgi:hypothetical protein
MKLQKITLFSLFLLVFGLAAAVAANKPVKNYKGGDKLPFKLEMDQGKPIKVIFTDGREATLFARQVPDVLVEVPVQVEETTCSEVRPKSACTLKFGIRKIEVALRWTKNPQSKRLNKDVITFKGRNNKDEEQNGDKNDDADDDGEEDKTVDFDETITFEYKDFYPNIVKNIHGHELVCEDFRWLGQTDLEAPESIHIVEWGLENMLVNSETEENENRISAGALDVIMNRKNKNSLQIKHIGNLVAGDISSASIISGDLIGWTIKKDDDFCQTSIKMDLAAATDFYTKKLDEEESKVALKPFIYNPKDTLWEFFMAKGIENGFYTMELEEPYKTLSILELIEVTRSATTQSHGKTEYEFDITRKTFK